ncbi:MAG: copper transporter [Clostridiaceae bacterium]|nr:copper transporter [Clostridiaceae bacterium]
MGKGIMYHIITIVAVFTALGVGIFVGSMLNGERLVATQQSKLMSELDGSLRTIAKEKELLYEEIGKLEQELHRKDQLIQCIYEGYIKGGLEGLNIALIGTGDSDLFDDINLLLQSAGAFVCSSTLIKNLQGIETMGYGYTDLYSQGAESPVDGMNGVQKLMLSLISGKDLDLVQQAESMGFIEAQGDYHEQIDYIVWIGPNEKGRESVYKEDVPMLEIIKKLNIPVMFVERSDSPYSATDIFKKFGFSTIDHGDTVYGKISLLMCLRGASGNYGVKKTAVSLFPKPDYETSRRYLLTTGE